MEWMPGERSRSLVRIWDSTGPVGCGFLVDMQHVMTCAHVVAQAVGDPKGQYAQSVAPPPGPIQVDFLALSAKGEPVTYPVEPVPAGWRPEKAPDSPRDIAVLRLLKPPPAGVRAVSAAPATFAADSFSAFGIKQHLLEGTWVNGQITDTVATGVLEVFCDHKDQAVRKGCSGGAAWNVLRGGILGMVAALTSEHKGHIIPIDHLQQVWSLDRAPPQRDPADRGLRPEYSLPARLGKLLYRCDRELQETQFDQAMEDNWRSLRGVLVCTIAGVPADLPGLCRDRCINIKLRDHLATLRIGKLPIVTKIHWPSDANKPPAATMLLLKQQVKMAVNARAPLAADIRAAINNGVAPWVFSLSLEKRTFKRGHLDVLLDFIQFWRELGAAGLNKPVVVFLVLHMDGASPAGFCLEEFFDQQLPGLVAPPLARLDALDDFPPEDVQTWLQRIATEVQVSEDLLEEVILALWKQFPHQRRLRLAEVDDWLRARAI